MRWNPELQKWEGNEDVLRDFDPPPPPLRPALITNFGANARTPQTVGNMVWDPVTMSWRGNEDDGLVFDGFDDEDDNKSMISVATGLTGGRRLCCCSPLLAPIKVIVLIVPISSLKQVSRVRVFSRYLPPLAKVSSRPNEITSYRLADGIRSVKATSLVSDRSVWLHVRIFKRFASSYPTIELFTRCR